MPSVQMTFCGCPALRVLFAAEAKHMRACLHLREQRGDLIHTRCTLALHLLDLLAILVENGGGNLADAEVVLDLGFLINVDGVSIAGGLVLGSESEDDLSVLRDALTKSTLYSLVSLVNHTTRVGVD